MPPCGGGSGWPCSPPRRARLGKIPRSPRYQRTDVVAKQVQQVTWREPSTSSSTASKATPSRTQSHLVEMADKRSIQLLSDKVLDQVLDQGVASRCQLPPTHDCGSHFLTIPQRHDPGHLDVWDHGACPLGEQGHMLVDASRTDLSALLHSHRTVGIDSNSGLGERAPSEPRVVERNQVGPYHLAHCMGGPG